MIQWLFYRLLGWGASCQSGGTWPPSGRANYERRGIYYFRSFQLDARKRKPATAPDGHASRVSVFTRRLGAPGSRIIKSVVIV